MNDDLKAYIESGVLEMYAGGMLSDDENREVEQMAARYPEIKAEIDAIRSSLVTFALASDGPRPPSLDQVLTHIRHADSGSRVLGLAPAPAVARTNWLLAAVLAALALSLGMNFWQRFALKRLEINNEQLQAQYQEVKAREEYAVRQHNARLLPPQTVANPMPVLRDPSYTHVEVTKDTASDITLYWHPETHALYLHIHKLPVPSEEHQYQLWAVIDGVWVSAGIFNHNTSLQRLPVLEGKVMSFAVTLEPKGGSPLPTQKRVFAQGSVKI
jgi:anti-sigma-K factor RskA